MKKTVGAAHFYLLTNPTEQAATTTIEFSERTVPEIWDAWTGDVYEAAFTRKNKTASFDVSLPPFGSELIEFDNSGKKRPAPVVWREMKRQSVGDDGWTVVAIGNSEKGVGVETHLKMVKLADWLEEPALRTLSGRATYICHVSVAADDLKKAERILLDLGVVKDAADVKVNQSSAATLVVHPFAAASAHCSMKETMKSRSLW